MQRVLGLIAVALIAAGLVVGFALPVHSGEYDCGTAFRENSGLEVDVLADAMLGKGDGVSGCDEARSSARTLPIVLLVIGGVALAGVPFMGAKTKESESVRA